MLYLQIHAYAKQDVDKRLQVYLLASMFTRAEPYRAILGTILGIGQTQSETQIVGAANKASTEHLENTIKHSND
ncbi:hypothetical protein G6F43_005531 [Rhizopus delemar]|nr:hypothetical protein G6F43_005531 [Rhizopus delemar]